MTDTHKIARIRAALARYYSLHKTDGDAWKAASVEITEACDNPAAMTAVLAHIDEQQAEIERLKRGEYICLKCGLRKTSEHPATHDF